MSVSYAPKRLRIPPGFEHILEGFTREVLRDQPEDIISFAADYFQKQLQIRENTGVDPTQPTVSAATPKETEIQRAEKTPEIAAADSVQTVDISPSSQQQPQGEEIDINLDDPLVKAAAGKIQAAYKSFSINKKKSQAAESHKDDSEPPGPAVVPSATEMAEGAAKDEVAELRTDSPNVVDERAAEISEVKEETSADDASLQEQQEGDKEATGDAITVADEAPVETDLVSNNAADGTQEPVIDKEPTATVDDDQQESTVVDEKENSPIADSDKETSSEPVDADNENQATDESFISAAEDTPPKGEGNKEDTEPRASDENVDDADSLSKDDENAPEPTEPEQLPAETKEELTSDTVAGDVVTEQDNTASTTVEPSTATATEEKTEDSKEPLGAVDDGERQSVAEGKETVETVEEVGSSKDETEDHKEESGKEATTGDQLKDSEDPANQVKDSEDSADQVKDSEDPADQVKDSEDQVKDSEDPTDQVKDSEDPADKIKDSEDQVKDSEDPADQVKDSEDQLKDSEEPADQTQDSTTQEDTT